MYFIIRVPSFDQCLKCFVNFYMLVNYKPCKIQEIPASTESCLNSGSMTEALKSTKSTNLVMVGFELTY